MDDPSKIDYFTAEGVNDDDFVQVCRGGQPGYQVDFSRLEYQPCIVEDLEGCLQYYRATYPKLPDELVMVMARVAIGKPMNRADRRAYAKDLKKQSRNAEQIKS